MTSLRLAFLGTPDFAVPTLTYSGGSVHGANFPSGTVTVRDRDTLKQERVDSSRLKEYLSAKLAR